MKKPEKRRVKKEKKGFYLRKCVSPLKEKRGLRILKRRLPRKAREYIKLTKTALQDFYLDLYEKKKLDQVDLLSENFKERNLNWTFLEKKTFLNYYFLYENDVITKDQLLQSIPTRSKRAVEMHLNTPLKKKLVPITFRCYIVIKELLDLNFFILARFRKPVKKFEFHGIPVELSSDFIHFIIVFSKIDLFYFPCIYYYYIHAKQKYLKQNLRDRIKYIPTPIQYDKIEYTRKRIYKIEKLYKEYRLKHSVLVKNLKNYFFK